MPYKEGAKLTRTDKKTLAAHIVVTIRRRRLIRAIGRALGDYPVVCQREVAMECQEGGD
jgi:hypothetical protein